MNKIGISALALVATAGSAFGQIDPARFRLDLSLVGREYSNYVAGTSADATTAASPISVLSTATGDARRVRLEIRYKITVLNPTTATSGNYASGGTNYASAGLVSASINLLSNQALAAGSLAAAQVAIPQAVNPPATESLDLTDGTVGIYPPFRTGVFSDVPAGTNLGNSNGTFGPNGLTNILPIATAPASPAHRSDQGSNNNIWVVASFDFLAPNVLADTTFTFSLAQNPGSDWLFFPRVGTTNAAAGISGTGGFTTGSGFDVFVQAVPAPGAAALLGLGGLVAARRRRTA